MDPVSLVLAAVAAGVSAGVSQTVTGAVQDAYAGLRSALVQRLRRDRDDESAERAVQGLEARAPEGNHAPVRADFVTAGVISDEQVLAAARRVLEAADPAGARVGKYVIDLRDAKGVQVGDNPTMTINF